MSNKNIKIHLPILVTQLEDQDLSVIKPRKYAAVIYRIAS